MKKGDKLRASERVSLTLRAYALMKATCPGLMRSILVKALATALQPFAAIWFSARILDEIAGARRLPRLALLAALVVAINGALSVVKGRIDILHSERVNQMWCYFGKIFADKQLSMDFVDIEDADVQKRKDKEKFNLFNYGNGLAQFVWTINGVIEGAVSAAASLAMVVTLFTSASGSAVMDSPLWILAIFAVVSLSMAVNSAVFRRNNALFMTWCDNTARLNRLLGFFCFTLCKDNARAKDVRLYRQDIPAEAELKKLERADASEKGYQRKYNANETLATLVTGLNHVACYLFVALKAFFGAFGVGSVVQYVGALGRLGDGLQKLIFGISDNAAYTLHLKSLFEFLDRPNRKYEGTLPVEKRDDNEYEIEFRGVSFRYPGAQRYALRNLNLKLNIGRRLAVVGMNGSGKTTMIKLLCRLYDPTEGEITLNGIDIRKYRYEEYTSLFGVVFQDFTLFAFSLGQNVAASTTVDERRAAECLRRAGFGARLRELPRGLDTPLYKDFEEDGVDISGGEAQKIALARALYRGAPFIVLDEPTAALDPMAEYEIYSKFNEIVGGKTAVYISHRLASCRFCDDIAVFHEGQLVQRGSHDALLADERGKYRALWFAQAQYYAEGDAARTSL